MIESDQQQRREEPRQQDKPPVQFESGKSITRGLSGAGVFFETDRHFSPGQPIEFTLVLEQTDPGLPLRLKCWGKMVRVDEIGGKIGVDTEINSYTFEELR
ncbi:MAG: PilZ domain-containing protein [Proteobacteria bacterium]|nr:PilZ domain-containing protein [Pseudomonadota bacterium]MBU1398544.1 PilZ domain-containing protein [Pseudomonadota bacterium]